MDENQTQPSEVHTSGFAKHRKLFEWTIALLLLAVVIGLVQIYMATKRAANPPTPAQTTEVTNETAEDDNLTYDEMLEVMDAIAGRPIEDGEGEDLTVDEMLVIVSDRSQQRAEEEEGEVQLVTEEQDAADMLEIMAEISQRPAEDESSFEE
jgi:hypothetical protein